MKRLLLRRILPLALLCLAGIFLLALSDNARMAPAAKEEKPYYVPERAVVAQLGGLGLTYEEFRWQAWQALTRDLGKDPGEVDLFYDETLTLQVKELALLRAARWRAVTVLAMEVGISAPEPDPAMAEALCREPFVTSGVAESILRAESLSSLVSLRRYGPEGSLLSDREAEEWGEENGVLRVRALWLSADPEIYSEAEIRGRLEQAEIFARQLRRGEADFDELCAAYGEDERRAAGRQLAPDCGERELYAAAAALETGGCAALRLEDGVYLILRCPPAAEALTHTGEGAETLRSLAARSLFSRAVGETAAGLERRFTGEWKKIRMDLLFRQQEDTEVKENDL